MKTYIALFRCIRVGGKNILTLIRSSVELQR